MIRTCEIAGVKIDCKKLFQKVPTDSGMCCALNAENPLADSNYSHLVREMQNKNGETEKQRVKAKLGQRNGIRITLDLHSDDISFGTISNDFNAFGVYIGTPTEFPLMKERAVSLQPGFEHFLDLSGQVVTSEGIQTVDPHARHCYFSNEGNLDFYSNYTYGNCIF